MTAITTHGLTALLQSGGELSERFHRVWEKYWEQDHIAPAILDMCRMRLAQMHGAGAEIGLSYVDGISPQQADAIRRGTYGDRGRFDPGQIAALELAEVYAQDPNAITDEMTDAVKAHYGDAGLVCLVQALGFIEARIRLSLMFTGWNVASLN